MKTGLFRSLLAVFSMFNKHQSQILANIKSKDKCRELVIYYQLFEEIKIILIIGKNNFEIKFQILTCLIIDFKLNNVISKLQKNLISLNYLKLIKRYSKIDLCYYINKPNL
ncbi:hypothetical protein BpHYR1_024893 [Brachionus plicatilis]|uniref:Uncharacterized protein n=1 Tax=Brachionus plicatilis TaxID=10195 RepID=A0A3M7PH59_BRAPC|nr:hypothetical protein BpHYR1_024893 [Brachionus plicatilis]